ncbi:hypothetical protein JHK82_034346 [Glycine max]|nr:hypothetical protein JHK82_034346 [Glycine max]
MYRQLYFSSLPILTVPNAYLAADDHLSLAALVDILRYQSDLRALPSSGKLITTLLQTTGRTINNFSSIALNFLLADMDTSSVALSCFLWLSMNHPAMEEKILMGLMAVLSSPRDGDRRR